MSIVIKRIYAAPASGDGLRVLVDRLWPRGIKKVDAKLAFWMKELAPSQKLRVWFGHKPERFEVFGERYRRELSGNPLVAEMRALARKKRITLLYAARDPRINHAAILLSVLRAQPRPLRAGSRRSRITRTRT
ncbi:MAG TPA: DUF488 family protein [Steroidobacteraceae bacterium]|jgi:uncharacterized protein YeaO (DUF488 family)|nr:DUF488 family protein [Steroidobacteraceae bacterium]